MRANVPHHVLDATTHCPNCYSCLSAEQYGGSDQCSVECASGKNLLLLSSKAPLGCLYRADSEGRDVCTCPTHYVIQQAREK